MLLSRNNLLRFGLIKYLLNQLHAFMSDICVIELGLESKLSYFMTFGYFGVCGCD
jgi:hypothetical protein